MINKARNKARKAIESLYESTCTIRSYEKYKDPVTKQTKVGINPIPRYESQKCNVSKKSLSKNSQTSTVNNIEYEIKLFISPEIEIRQGDEIEVTSFDKIEKYKAGEGFLYTTHQEVILIREDKA